MRQTAADWLRRAPAMKGFERIEAYFSGHAYDAHRHDTYAIGYTLDGVQSFNYRGARADSCTGNVMILHPDEPHDGHAGARGGFHYRMLYIEPRLISEALGERARSLPFVRRAVQANPRLSGALRLALDELDRSLEPLETDRAITAIANALLELDPSARGRSMRAGVTGAVTQVREYLATHFTQVVAAAELEAIAGINRYDLARHFRRRFGTSPYRYLTMRRLERVRSALLAGHSPADAALDSGFCDQSHMTRQFKSTYGISPGRWLALLRKDIP